jgi:hypothetical protein
MLSAVIRLRWLLAACSIGALATTTASAQAESELQALRAWHAEAGGATTHASADRLFLESGTIRTTSGSKGS